MMYFWLMTLKGRVEKDRRRQEGCALLMITVGHPALRPMPVRSITLVLFLGLRCAFSAELVGGNSIVIFSSWLSGR